MNSNGIGPQWLPLSRVFAALCAATFVALFMPSTVLAQQQDRRAAPRAMAPESIRRAPVMISVEAQGPSAQAVIITYSVPVSRRQVEQDVANVRQSAGWVVGDLQITSSEPSSAVAAGSVRLYSAEFATAGALDYSTGQLPLAPIVKAMRRYGKMIVLFDLDGPFVYRGRTSYHNGALDIRMLPQRAGSGTYAFSVDISGPAAATLDFDTAPSENIQRHSNPLMLRIGIALLLAIIAGWIAYQLILRITLRAEGSSGS